MAQIARDTERPLDDTGLEEAPSTTSTGRPPGPDKNRRDAAPTSHGTTTPSAIRGSSAAEPPRIERIARRAYELYEQRGGERGQMQDWLEAERQIDGADDDPGNGTR
jgi:hypothetical protein